MDISEHLCFISRQHGPTGWRSNFPESRQYGNRKTSRIGRFIIELSIFGGLKIIQDYFQLLKSPLQIRSDAEIADWASSFESGYLTAGESVLSNNPEDHLPRLTLSSEVGRNMRHKFSGPVHLGSQELDTSDTYIFGDILTVLEVLPSALGGETTMLDVLKALHQDLRGDSWPREIPVAPYSGPSKL